MKCGLCPRHCGVDRTQKKGVCGAADKLIVARAGLHFWEEPCFSGSGGSGAIFFSGCPLKCVFCQNSVISHGMRGREISEERLAEIFDELIWQGADNINLVTPTHFSDIIARVLEKHRPSVPVIYNCGGYEDVEALKRLEGLIDIYLPDLKYMSAELAKKFSAAPDYPEKAKAALDEMYRQTGKYILDDEGLMQRGMLIRHLQLPGHTGNTLDTIDYISSHFGKNVLFSIMSQYTPPEKPLPYPELMRRLTQEEYDSVCDYIMLCGAENGFMQELSSAEKEYTPEFDLSGV